MLITLCLLALALVSLDFFLNRRQRAKSFYKIPGQKGAFIFGNCLQIVTSPENIFLKLRFWAKSYKNIYRQWIYPYGVIHIYSPEHIETIISNPVHNEKSLVYDYLRPWLKDGLLLSEGTKWLVRRKILTPAFHFNILRHFSTVLDDNSRRLVEKLENGEDYQTVDVIGLMSNVTLNSICETSMGTKLDEDNSSLGKIYKNAIHEIGKLIVYRIARSWLVFDAIFNLTNASKRQKEVLKKIHDFPKQIIRERRAYIEKHGFHIPSTDVDEEYFFGPRKVKMSMLDLLLAAEKKGLIEENGILEEVETFMFEGHDTTAMGLSFALLELANNPDIQDQVYDELVSIFGTKKRTATMEELSQLKYLDCCLKETLRLYPPVPFISRHITQGAILGDYIIPPGRTLCHIHIFDLHRKPDLYENPVEFNPERFTAENCAKRHPYAYIPFSGGPRNCIGQKFAILEMKSVIAAILRRFKLEPVTRPSDLQFSADLVLRTTHPVHVKFTKRFVN